jgi:hypothetical protein
MRAAAVALSIAVLAGCATEREPLPVTPPGEGNAAAVVRRPLPEAVVPVPPAVSVGPPKTAALPAIRVPPDLLYVCVTDVNGEVKQVGIEFAPKVHKLCAHHPEMGPCQYERNACRRSGGRVFAANGDEITTATEAEYDKKVMRVRFRAN